MGAARELITSPPAPNASRCFLRWIHRAALVTFSATNARLRWLFFPASVMVRGSPFYISETLYVYRFRLPATRPQLKRRSRSPPARPGARRFSTAQRPRFAHLTAAVDSQ